MGINTDDNMETQICEQYGGADVPAATPASASAVEPDMAEDTAAISPHKDKRTWNETLELLQDTHTISMRDICQQLKSSRSWVSKYIIPYIDKLYLDTGYRGNKMVTKSWTKTAAIMLNDDKYLNNSLWCHEEQYDRLIRMHAVSITKQTTRIPVELLVQDKRKFAKEYNLIADKISNNEAELRHNGYNKELVDEMDEDRKVLEMIVDDNMSEMGKAVLDAGMTIITKRSSTVPVDVPLPATPISEWRALHDEKSYGDTDESILRKYFKEGCIRVEIHIPDPKEMADPAAIFDSDNCCHIGANTATICASPHVNSADKVADSDNNMDNNDDENMTANMNAINSDCNSDHITATISDTVNSYHRGTIQEPILESKRQQNSIKCSKKVYYIADPAPIKHQYVDRYVTISEKVWQQWEKKLIP